MAKAEKNILLGVTASIAIYKSCELIRKLKECGFIVTVAMTREAEELIRPIVFQSLSGRRVYRGGIFDEPDTCKLENNGLASGSQSHKLENNGLASGSQSHKPQGNGLPTDKQSQKEQFEPPVADFKFFVTTLTLQASIALGHMANPTTEKVEEDLAQAKFLIDTLGMLQEKTKNNLAQEETKLLENLLYELRVAYLAKGKGELK